MIHLIMNEVAVLITKFPVSFESTGRRYLVPVNTCVSDGIENAGRRWMNEPVGLRLTTGNDDNLGRNSVARPV
jgi:hypothetical protein